MDTQGQAQQRKSFIKLVVIGDSGVGKSSLIHFFQKGYFTDNFKPTIGADFANKEVTIDDDHKVVLQIWDTAGQERFQSLSSAFYRGADCCCIVYDITDTSTFDHISTWKGHFLSKAQLDQSQTIPILVLGNKSDLSSQRTVQFDRAKQFCKDNDNMLFYEVSAKDAMNVNDAFNDLAALAVSVQTKRLQQMGGSAGERPRGRKGLKQRAKITQSGQNDASLEDDDERGNIALAPKTPQKPGKKSKCCK